MAADDAALASGSRASDYAGFLLGIARAVSARHQVAGAAVLAMAGGSPLGERVERLLEPVAGRRGVNRRLAALAASGMLALALPLGCLGSGDDAGARAGGTAWAMRS